MLVKLKDLLLMLGFTSNEEERHKWAKAESGIELFGGDDGTQKVFCVHNIRSFHESSKLGKCFLFCTAFVHMEEV